MKAFNWVTHLSLDKMAPISETILRCIFVYETFYILIQISLTVVLMGLIDNNPTLI